MSRYQHKPLHKSGPLFISAETRHMKDPCIVYDGTLWHIFGTGNRGPGSGWRVLHATAPDITGPWTEEAPSELKGLEGPSVAAPSVIFDTDDRLFHMAIQTDFTAVAGSIEYLVSADGATFTWMRTLLDPVTGSSEAGLYDPHFSVIRGKKYLVYAGMPAVMTNDKPFTPQPDIYLAESESGLWAGPWKRVDKILDHDHIEWHHNRREHPDYEWGIEGPQLIELPGNKILLNATCFVQEGPRGTRQRVFFAIAEDPSGPYISLGPVLSERDQPWESGENGHATGWIKDDRLYLFYQARSQEHPQPDMNPWRYGLAQFDVQDLSNASMKDRELG